MTVSLPLLGLAIVAVWLPKQLTGIPLWLPLFAAAVVSGIFEGVLGAPAVAALVALSAATLAAQRVTWRAVAVALQILVALGALALAMHAIPGFNNPVLASQVGISPDAAPYTLRANFDKGAAGLLLLVLFTTPITSLKRWRQVLPPTLLGTVATASIVIGIALGIGYVRPDVKVPDMAPYFLAINLLFTCIPEEAFFRGLLQERISSSRLGQAAGAWLPVAASTLLFGVVHFGGGPIFLALATVAGLGYSLAYQFTRRVEVAILVHFGVNAIHFFGFTYPYLAR